MKTITKVLCLLLCLTMLVGMITSCDSGNAGNPNSSQDLQTEEISKPSEESKDPEPGPIPTEGLSYTLLDDDINIVVKTWFLYIIGTVRLPSAMLKMKKLITKNQKFI